jgi:hypothetical protein
MWQQVTEVARGALETLLGRLSMDPKTAKFIPEWVQHRLGSRPCCLVEQLTIYGVALTWAEVNQLDLGPSATCNHLLGRHLATLQRGARRRHESAMSYDRLVRCGCLPLLEQFCRECLHWQPNA